MSFDQAFGRIRVSRNKLKLCEDAPELCEDAPEVSVYFQPGGQIRALTTYTLYAYATNQSDSKFNNDFFERKFKVVSITKNY